MTLPYQRVRTRSDTPTTQFYETHGIQGVSDSTEGPYQDSYKNEYIEDVVTPGYREIIRRGGIVNNSCVYTCDSRKSSGSGFGHFELSGYIWECSGAVTQHVKNATGLGGPAPVVSVDDGRATAKLRAIAAMDSSAYAFGEDIGEIGETIRFLRRPMTSLHRLSKEYRKDLNKVLRKKRINVRDAKQMAKAHADAWLEYRFAVSPLVRSASDLLESFDTMPKTPPPRQTARGFSRDSDSDSTESSVYNGGTTFVFKQTREVTRSDKASILYQVSNPVYDWRWRYGLRNKDIPETIWQLVPYSFMVDRVLDVSSAVRAITNLADPSLSILAASVTTKHENKFSYQHVNQIRSGLTCTVNGNTVTDTSFSYTRDTWRPSLSDTVPQFKPAGLVDDLTKIADLTSLILSNFRR